MRTRLDAVVTVRERSEEKALRQVVEAEARAKTAAEKAEALRAATLVDHRRTADAATWELLETAHVRAISDARRAQKDAEQAQAQVGQVRLVYTAAHQQAEVVRRVADARREEAQKEIDRAEDKQLDEVASLLWFRKAG
jgi:flagellar protein FliJ